MSNDAIETWRAIEQKTHLAFKVESRKGYYIIKEGANGQELSLCIRKLNNTICFIIDKTAGSQEHAFPFLKYGTTKKNDAILIIYFEKKIFVFLIEMKTSSPREYLKQIKGGRDFVEILLDLLERNKCCKKVEPNYFAVLCFDEPSVRGGRESAKKNPTRHDTVIQFENDHGWRVCKWRKSTLNVKDLLGAATEAPA
ncbi:MAG: hypothetical protein ACKN9T_11365 [Candidatus Methylumidiphilus sp.]